MNASDDGGLAVKASVAATTMTGPSRSPRPGAQPAPFAPPCSAVNPAAAATGRAGRAGYATGHNVADAIPTCAVHTVVGRGAPPSAWRGARHGRDIGHRNRVAAARAGDVCERHADRSALDRPRAPGGFAMKLSRLWQPGRLLFWQMVFFNVMSSLCTWVMRSYPLNTVGMLLLAFIALLNVAFGLAAAWRLLKEPQPLAQSLSTASTTEPNSR